MLRLAHLPVLALLPILALLPTLALLVTSIAHAQDVFLKNVKGYTVQGDALTRFDALLIKGGKVQAIGAAQILEPYAQPGTVRDMGGKTVFPGLSNIHTALSYRAQDYCASNPSKSLEDCILTVLANEAKRGVTIAQDAATNMETWAVLRSLEDRNMLPIRVFASVAAHTPSYEPLMKLGAYVGTYKHQLSLRSISWRRSHPVHSCLPGNIAKARSFNHTYKPLDPIALRNRIARGVMRGYQLRIGSSGEAEAGQVLAAFADVIDLAGTGGRHMFAPLRQPKGDVIETLKSNGLILGIAPCLDPLVKNSNAPSVMRKSKNDLDVLQKASGEGVSLAMAQGYPVRTLAAIGQATDADVRLLAAFKAYTLGGAYAAFWEANLGSLDTGKWADFVVLDHDIFQPAARAGKPVVQVLETWVAGKRVYKR